MPGTLNAPDGRLNTLIRCRGKTAAAIAVYGWLGISNAGLASDSSPMPVMVRGAGP